MLRNIRIISVRNYEFSKLLIQNRTFLTNDYKCQDIWNNHSSTILEKVNLNDFYNILHQNYSSKGVLSALDVDIFANAVKGPGYLEEIKDLLHKLRLSAETGNTLESTHHAIIRNLIEHNNIQDLVDMLKQPINYGLFLDNYLANVLLDKLITSEKYDLATDVASLIMLQEEYTNDITNALCLYGSYKYIITHSAPETVQIEEKSKNKIEEVKIRVKYLRNPYYDDHFDIKDRNELAGKTLAWISEQSDDNLHNNLQIIGWAVYKKFDKLSNFIEKFANTKTDNAKVYPEVIDILKKQVPEAEGGKILEQCISTLKQLNTSETTLENSLMVLIENAINKSQSKDIQQQQKLFESWGQLREKKFEEQTQRLDRAKRIQIIQEKQALLDKEEQKLWFFENEEQIDLKIEEKQMLDQVKTEKKSESKKSDDNYIPPEILPKRR